MARAGVRVDRMIHGGGIPRKNPLLNQVFANVLQRPVLVPREDAQAAMTPTYGQVDPQRHAREPYDELHARFATLYDVIAPFARTHASVSPA